MSPPTAVLGAGCFGTSLAVLATRAHDVKLWSRRKDLVSAVKGIEFESGLVALSGPSFASEIARRRPTMVTLACREEIHAIAVGISDGMEGGHNARAALMTRGLTEITRIGVAQGAEAETFLGLAGMGDLLLTCTGDLSRSRRIGRGRGRKLDEIVAEAGYELMTRQLRSERDPPV